MQKEILSEENEKKLKGVQDAYTGFLKSLLKKSGGLIKTLGFILVQYAILSWIYLSIMDAWGFERAVILAIIGVIMVASRSNKG